MLFRLRSLFSVVTLLTPCATLGLWGFAEPTEVPYSLKNYKKPAPLKKDEPLAKQFSPQKAAQALDSASLEWVTKSKCFTCHTNVAYLYARPLISADDPAPREIRQALESLFSDSKKKDRGIQHFHLTAEATTLAINDSITTKKLHPLTKKALDQMWKDQSPDGVLFWVVEMTRWAAPTTVSPSSVLPSASPPKVMPRRRRRKRDSTAFARG